MRFRSVVPGISLLIVVGLLARAIAAVAPLNHLIAAVLCGTLIKNIVGLPQRYVPGVDTHKLWLETGIVMMGAGISLERVVEAGPLLLALILGVTAATLLTVELIARTATDIPEKLGSLLACGASVCGVSAVVAVARGIDADESHIAYASATILVFDTATLFTYPIVADILALSDFTYGVWAGVTMFSTGPATAAGFAHSTAAGQWAVLTKLTRNALIGVVALGYALYYTRIRSEQDGETLEPTGFWEGFPTFFVGFVVLLVLGNTVLGPSTLRTLEHASNWLFLVAFAGLGLELDLDTLRSSGIGPIGVVLASFFVFSIGILVLLMTLV